MIVAQSFGVRFACIRRILFELYMREKKKKEERRKKKKKNKMEIFAFNFLDCEEKEGNSGAIFYIRIAKAFHL